MEHLYYHTTPLGGLVISDDGQAVTGVRLCASPPKHAEAVPSPPALLACTQLDAYFSGKRKSFDLPLDLKGTEFQRRVWRALREIPYGETRSYKQIAEASGNPKACRAVGGASHRNPVLIIVPCHRVIGSDKSLTGFGCGLSAKEFLLRLERENR